MSALLQSESFGTLFNTLKCHFTKNHEITEEIIQKSFPFSFVSSFFARTSSLSETSTFGHDELVDIVDALSIGCGDVLSDDSQYARNHDVMDLDVHEGGGRCVKPSAQLQPPELHDIKQAARNPFVSKLLLTINKDVFKDYVELLLQETTDTEKTLLMNILVLLNQGVLGCTEEDVYSLSDYLQKSLETTPSSVPHLSCLAYCSFHTTVQQFFKKTQSSTSLYRTLLKNLTSTDHLVVFYSISILSTLALETDLGRRFFHGSNFNSAMSVLLKACGDQLKCDNEHEILKSMLPDIAVKTIDRLLHDEKMKELVVGYKPLEQTLRNSKPYPPLLHTLLKHEVKVDLLMDIITDTKFLSSTCPSNNVQSLESWKKWTTLLTKTCETEADYWLYDINQPVDEISSFTETDPPPVNKDLAKSIILVLENLCSNAQKDNWVTVCLLLQCLIRLLAIESNAETKAKKECHLFCSVILKSEDRLMSFLHMMQRALGKLFETPSYLSVLSLAQCEAVVLTLDLLKHIQSRHSFADFSNSTSTMERFMKSEGTLDICIRVLQMSCVDEDISNVALRIVNEGSRENAVKWIKTLRRVNAWNCGRRRRNRSSDDKNESNGVKSDTEPRCQCGAKRPSRDSEVVDDVPRLNDAQSADQTLQALQKLERDFASLQQRLQQEMQIKESVMANKVSAYESIINGLKNETSKLKEFCDVKQSQAKDAERLCVEYRSKIDFLKDQISTLKLTVQDLSASNTTIRADLTACQEVLSKKDVALKDKSRELDELRSTVRIKDQETKDLKQRLDKCSSRLENILEERCKFEELLNGKQSELVALQKEHKACSNKYSTLETQLTTLQQKMDLERDVFMKKRQQYKNMISKLESELEDHENMASRLAESLAGLSKRGRRRGNTAVVGNGSGGNAKSNGQSDTKGHTIRKTSACASVGESSDKENDAASSVPLKQMNQLQI